MDAKQQCPNCGKPIPGDKTYCMHCGTTVGVKCPECKGIIPLHQKSCPLCGHSFAQKGKTRTKKARPPLWPKVAGRAPWITAVMLAIIAIALLVLTAFPVMDGTLTDHTKKEPLIIEFTTSGYELLLHFCGIPAQGIRSLLQLKTIKDIATPLGACLYAQGAGLLLCLVCLCGCAVLAIFHGRHMSKITSRRLLLWTGIALGGALLSVVFGFIGHRLLADTISVAYPQLPDTQPDRVFTLGGLSPLWVPATAALAFLTHLFWHLTVLRRVNPTDGIKEYTLRGLLARPFRALFRHLRGSTEDHVPVLSCTKLFYVHLALLGVSLIFTQALLNKVSHIFFWFMLLLPLPLLLYTLLARRALQVTLLCSTTTTEKNTPYSYEFVIENRSLLAFPFIDATISIPQANNVRCTDRSVRLSMAPKSRYHMKNTVTFRFRGTYDIGVRCFYVYDFFRMFRVHVPMEEISTIYVLPPRRTLDEALTRSFADATARTVKTSAAVDKLEVSDIRDYRYGDPLKSIHWKLSSKAEDPVVKDYNTGTSDKTAIFCDLAAHFPNDAPMELEEAPPQSRQKKASAKQQKKQRSALPPAETSPPSPDNINIHELKTPLFYEDMNEYLADGVVELTIALALAELRQGHSVLLAWFDRRSADGLYTYPLRSLEEFEAVYPLFATAPIAPPEKKMTMLTTAVDDIQSNQLLFVSTILDQQDLTDLVTLPGVSDANGFGASEVAIYYPEERFRYPEARRSYIENCREQLAHHGVSLHLYTSLPGTDKGGDKRHA